MLKVVLELKRLMLNIHTVYLSDLVYFPKCEFREISAGVDGEKAVHFKTLCLK